MDRSNLAVVSPRRKPVFYPAILIVIASYYVLFAVMGGSMRALVLESIVMSAFALCAVAGLKRNLWLVVAALAAHGVFDFFHVHIVNNPGVPEWWPGFCLAYDAGAAASLAWLVKVSGRRESWTPGREPNSAVRPS